MELLGFFPFTGGTMMHDAWKPYFRYPQAQHALCNVHLLRELQSLWEIHEHGWAKVLMDLLLEIKQEVEQDERARQYERMYERPSYIQHTWHTSKEIPTCFPFGCHVQYKSYWSQI
ncbi:hypothetical protein J2S06_001627 [Bacillus alveayuensis]|uniref:Transposase IS66 central domain-containing protein n=2 Tax=Aeribacillus alveayuensis TaxID=279215 RepID=A0ABT9VNI7_9BACI|nr:hypothetical protein [Bacillus alveayuensis]